MVIIMFKWLKSQSIAWFAEIINSCYKYDGTESNIKLRRYSKKGKLMQDKRHIMWDIISNRMEEWWNRW